MSELIAAIAGLQGAGKSSAARFLHEKHDFTIISAPETIRQYAADHEIDLRERSQWAEIRRRLSEIHGRPDWHAQMAIDAAKTNRVAIDGLSTIGDFDTLYTANKLNFARVAFVALECSPEIRFRHVLKRADPTKEIPRSVEEMLAKEKDEYYSLDEYGIARMAVLDDIPESMTIEYGDESDEKVVHERLIELLAKADPYLAK